MIRRIAYHLLTPVILLAGIVFLALHSHELKNLAHLSFSDIGSVFVLISIFYIFIGFRFKVLVSVLSVPLTLWESMSLSLLSNFMNYFAPVRPGMVMKAWYMKSALDLKYHQFTSVMAASAFISFFAVGSLGLLVTVFYRFQLMKVPLILPIVCGLIFAGSFFPVFIKIRSPLSSNRIAQFIKSAIDGFYELKSKRLALSIVLLLYYAQFFIIAALLMIIFMSMGIDLSFSNSLTISLLIFISNLFAVIPNNLGVKEVIVGLLISNVGYSFSAGVIGSSLMRICMMLATTISAPFATLLKTHRKTHII